MKGLFDLSGKVAIVTGGNGGIGLGMALGLAGQGADIAIVGRNATKSAEAAKKIADETGVKTLAITCDVAKESQVNAAIAQIVDGLGRIDILINNAGINIRKQPQDLSLAEFQEVMDVNLTSAFLMAKAAYPAMKLAGAGKIINIGSMTSIYGSSFASAYASSKGAIVQLTKSLALSWAPDHIQVNAILPGWIDTELTEKARVEVAGLHERVLVRIPHGRWGKPADLAGTAIWLSSPASDYVTGVAVAVDGGYTSAI